MAELASLQIKVVRDGIEQAQKALNDLARAADAAEKEVDGFSRKSDETNKKTKSFASDVMNLAKAFAGLWIVKEITSAIIGFAGAGIKAAAAMEQNEIAFGTMLGSAEKAKNLLSQMQDFAANTPFSFNEVVDAGKRLVAFGFSAESVVGNLRMLGDVAAGLSQPVGDMVYLFGQIKTQGRAMTQDLMQFANRGVPIYDELAKVLGVSTSQVKDFASQGKIGFKEIEQVFKNMTAAGGKFGGLMEAQAQSLSGKWSNFGDALDTILVKMGKLSEKNVKGLVDELNRGAKEGGVIDYGGQVIGEGSGLLASGLASILKMINDSGDRSVTIENAIKDKMEEKRVLLKKMDHQYRGILGVSADELNSTMKQVGILDEQIEKWKKIKEIREQFGPKERGDLEASDLKSFGPRGVLSDAEMKALKDSKKNSGSGSGEPKWMKDQQYLQNILKSSGAEIDQINAKYGEQLEKINKIKQSWGENTNTHKMAVETEKAVIESKNKAMYEAETRLASFDSVVKKSLTTGLISALEITSLKGKKAAAVIGDLLTDIGGAAISAGMQAFEKLGYSLGQGASGFKALSSALADFADMLLKTLPMMFVQAGLMAIANGNMGLGLTFVGIGLSGAVVNGFREGMKAKKDQESQSSTTNAAQGAVFGFAKGGSFTNEIINSPTRFAFAKGGGMASGLMGEAGIEGVVPLKRMSNGNLGVESSGGGNVNINIINGSGEKVDVQEKTSPGGTTDITVTIGAIVNKQLVEGSYDRAMKYRYGIGQKGV
jgi:lambda family phage tail tape measure protein